MMRNHLVLVFLLFIFPAAADADQGNSATTEFVKANLAYRDGKYEEAIKGYEALIASGVESGPIYYNLGNSYFKAGQVGKAVLNYERSRKLIPRDSEVLVNKKFVLSSVSSTDPVPQNFWEKLWQRHIDFYTINEMTLILAVLVFFCGLVHVLGLYRNWPRLQLIKAVSILGIIFFLYAAGFWSKINAEKNLGIVVKAVPARFEPNEKATVYFDLFEGQRVKTKGQEGDWQKIERSDGKLGWIPKNSVERI